MDIQQKILDSALALTRQRGYHAITMDEIAEHAGVSKGALYWYFKSKKGLFLGLIDYWVDHIADDLTREQGEARGAMNKINCIIDVFMSQFYEHPAVFEVEPEFWAQARQDTEVKNKVQRVYGDLRERIERVLTEGVARQELMVQDPHLAAMTILINLESCVWFTLFSNNKTDYRSYINNFKQTVLKVLIRERSQS